MELDEGTAQRLSAGVEGAAVRPMRATEIEAVLDKMRRLEPRGGATEQEWDAVVEEIGAALNELPPMVFSCGEEA